MFKQIKTSNYRLTNSYEIIKEANELVSSISGDYNFSDIISNTLRNQLISRIVSNKFLITEGDVFNTYPYITILVDIDDSDLIVTLGAIPDGEDNVVYLNGILEV